MKTRILTRTILLVSFVSLFTDVASEMLYPVMPVYLTSIGFSVLLIGILESADGGANWNVALRYPGAVTIDAPFVDTWDCLEYDTIHDIFYMYFFTKGPRTWVCRRCCSRKSSTDAPSTPAAF